MKSAAATVNVTVLMLGWNDRSGRRLQVAVEDDANGVGLIVDEAERRHRAGRQPEVRHQPLRRREAQFAVADLIGHRSQIRFLRRLEHDEVMAVAFLVPQKEILAVRRVDLRPVRFGFLDGRHRRMLVTRVADASSRRRATTDASSSVTLRLCSGQAVESSIATALRLEPLEAVRRERLDPDLVEDLHRRKAPDQRSERDAAVHHRQVDVAPPFGEADDRDTSLSAAAASPP